MFFNPVQNSLKFPSIQPAASDTKETVKDTKEDDQKLIDELKVQLATKTAEFSELQKLSMKQEKEINQLKEAISSLENSNSQIKDENNDFKEKVQELKKKILQLSEESLKDKKDHIERQEELVNEMKILDISDINELETLEEISVSVNSKVLKVAKKAIYVLKILNSKNITFKQMQRFMSEYEIMNALNHPNILKAYGIFISNQEKPPMILLEYCPMNLDEAIKNGTLNKVQIACSIYEIASGLKYVHIHHIIHRDIKPTNILISTDGHMKVSDFGISKLISNDDESMTMAIGTQKFMAPEIINEEEYDEKVDIYSFGVLVYFILSGGIMPKITIAQIGIGKKAEIPSTFTKFSHKLIDSCWNFKPSDRPSFENICEQLRKRTHKLLDLSKSEQSEVKRFIENHQKIIPQH